VGGEASELSVLLTARLLFEAPEKIVLSAAVKKLGSGLASLVILLIYGGFRKKSVFNVLRVILLTLVLALILLAVFSVLNMVSAATLMLIPGAMWA